MHRKRLKHKPRLLFDRGKRNYEYFNRRESFSQQEHLSDKGTFSCEALSPANKANTFSCQSCLFLIQDER